MMYCWELVGEFLSGVEVIELRVGALRLRFVGIAVAEDPAAGTSEGGTRRRLRASIDASKRRLAMKAP